MRSLIFALSLIFMNTATAAKVDLLDCKAVEILDSSYLEESFSMDEYPYVWITREETGELTAHLGIGLFEESDDDTITIEKTVGFDQAYTISPSHLLDQYRLIVTGNPMNREGKLFARSRKDMNYKYGQWGLIARLTCK